MINPTVEDNLIQSRLAEVVRANIGGDLYRWIELPNDVIKRSDYEERTFIVSWGRDHDSHRFGTHRACLNSNGESQLVSGTFHNDDKGAYSKFIERHPVLNGVMSDKKARMSEKAMTLAMKVHVVREA